MYGPLFYFKHRSPIKHNSSHWIFRKYTSHEKDRNSQLKKLINAKHHKEAFSLAVDMLEDSTVIQPKNMEYLFLNLSKMKRLQSIETFFLKEEGNMAKHYSVKSWGIFLNTLVREGDIDKAMHYFLKFKTHYKPNLTIYNTLINGLMFQRRYDEVNVLLDECKALGIPIDNFTRAIMIKGYLSNGELEKATEYFNSIKEKDVAVYNNMLHGLLSIGRVNQALELYQEITEKGLVDDHTYRTIIKYAIKHRNFELLNQIINEMKTPTNDTCNIIVFDMIQKLGDVKYAVQFYLDHMEKNDIPPSKKNATLLIENLAVSNNAFAVQLFSSFQKKRYPMEPTAYNAVLKYFLKRSEHLINEMQKKEIKFDSELESLLNAETKKDKVAHNWEDIFTLLVKN
eukprot:TRINITY_DN10768_c0_g1_i1.p1 TRINITY_DN10768_c0_g1~~TRINITY_DN10768_c0_g1_i1.p1  ORF type:complete len:397 (+),score=60.16 TRINITY_DN10768_c0_g1_i1:74-1264(+)